MIDFNILIINELMINHEVRVYFRIKILEKK